MHKDISSYLNCIPSKYYKRVAKTCFHLDNFSLLES